MTNRGSMKVPKFFRFKYIKVLKIYEVKSRSNGGILPAVEFQFEQARNRAQFIINK